MHETLRSHPGFNNYQTAQRVLAAIRDLDPFSDRPIRVKDIASRFAQLYGIEYSRPITAKWIGQVLRRSLGLSPYRSKGGFYVLYFNSPHRIKQLFDRYGLMTKEVSSGRSDEPPV